MLSKQNVCFQVTQLVSSLDGSLKEDANKKAFDKFAKEKKAAAVETSDISERYDSEFCHNLSPSRCQAFVYKEIYILCHISL